MVEVRVGDQDRVHVFRADADPGQQLGRVTPDRDAVLVGQFPAAPGVPVAGVDRGSYARRLRSTVKQYGISRSPDWPCSSSPSGELARANSITQME